jgi:hypothetical protein
MNSHLSGRSFSVPILATTVIGNQEFRDVAYHSGEPYDGSDWTFEASPIAGWASWSTDSFGVNPNANALRWSTMYSFRFDADTPPEPAIAVIGLFRDGGPKDVSVMVEAPANNVMPLFSDGFESGTTDAWSVVVP